MSNPYNPSTATLLEILNQQMLGTKGQQLFRDEGAERMKTQFWPVNDETLKAIYSPNAPQQGISETNDQDFMLERGKQSMRDLSKSTPSGQEFKPYARGEYDEVYAPHKAQRPNFLDMVDQPELKKKGRNVIRRDYEKDNGAGYQRSNTNVEANRTFKEKRKEE